MIPHTFQSVHYLHERISCTFWKANVELSIPQIVYWHKAHHPQTIITLLIVN